MPISKIPRIQNPKSKIPQIQNPKSPKSKIQNPRNLGPHKDLLHNGPKSKIQNPQNRPKKFGFWILDWGKIQNGFRPQNPKSKIPKIQNPKSPKSKIQNPKSPRSKIQNPPNPQNPQNPKSCAKIQNLGRWGPHIKICYITIQNPKSKIPKIHNLGILDFGFGGFWILDFGDLGFWILDLGDFGFWTLDLGDFGFWILGILDFGFCWFWCFWGGPGDVPLGNLVTVLGGQRLESPLVRLSGTVQNQLYLI